MWQMRLRGRAKNETQLLQNSSLLSEQGVSHSSCKRYVWVEGGVFIPSTCLGSGERDEGGQILLSALGFCMHSHRICYFCNEKAGPCSTLVLTLLPLINHSYLGSRSVELSQVSAQVKFCMVVQSTNSFDLVQAASSSRHEWKDCLLETKAHELFFLPVS